MANFRPLIIGLLLAGLFAITLINFGIIIARENGANQSIADDPAISSYASSLNSSLDTAYTDANLAQDAISNSTITLTSSIPFFDSIAGIWKTMKSVPVSIYKLTTGLLRDKLMGGEAFYIVFGILGAILTITIIFAVWKWVSTGEGG